MSYYDQSYPPHVLRLGSSHDLALSAHVDDVNPLQMHFDTNNAGRAVTFDFGDGTTHTTSDGQTAHTYDMPGTRTVVATSGAATDETEITVAEPTPPESPEGNSFGDPVPVDELPPDQA